MSSKLPNYLHTYRRRLGFSQDEIAFLLGGHTDTTVSRHERLSREPYPRSVFAYEVIFGAPARDLFAGIYRDVETRTRDRARLLVTKLSAHDVDPRTRRKLEFLRRIADGRPASSAPAHE